MRYLVTARVKPGQETALLDAIDAETLGEGSIAGDEYLRNMANARTDESGRVKWVEVCYCPTPLAEEREYWEEFFNLEKVQDAHARSRCRDLNGDEPWPAAAATAPRAWKRASRQPASPSARRTAPLQ